MKKLKVHILLLFGCFLLLSQTAYSQSKITFAINLGEQIKSGEFSPSNNSVYLTGNQLPFSSTNKIKLNQSPEADSIFVATVEFPQSVVGKTLKYNFVLEINGEQHTEDRSRVLNISDQDGVRRLDLAYFNSFAQ